MMRQPPKLVPSPMVRAQTTMTQKGISNTCVAPPASMVSANTPMNFCPSLRPWLKAMKAAETICSTSNWRLARLGRALPASRITSLPISRAPPNPSPSEQTSPIPTFCQPVHCRAVQPPPASAAPARPASSACDLLTGMPKRAAMPPQAMMLSIAAVMAGRVMAEGSTMPLPTVVATAVPAIAPTVLSTTAMATAVRGPSTPVDTTVAMTFGASVQPLMNSAISTAARATRGRWSCRSFTPPCGRATG